MFRRTHPLSHDSFVVEVVDSAIRHAGLAFGHGAHICIGASLATMELNTGLRALLSRFSTVIAPDPPESLEWNMHLAARGPLHLPIILQQ